MKLDKNYEEKVYAGVLGKIIGVYLGRPFEGWTYERIMEELGPINYYVNDKLKQPICVTDDDTIYLSAMTSPLAKILPSTVNFSGTLSHIVLTSSPIKKLLPLAIATLFP